LALGKPFFGENGVGHLPDGGVLKGDNATVRPLLHVNSGGLTRFIVSTAKIVPYSVFTDAQPFGNQFHAAGGKSVFDSSEFIESYIHDRSDLVLYQYFFEEPKYRFSFPYMQMLHDPIDEKFVPLRLHPNDHDGCGNSL
jgi:hypothetical protein